MLDDFLNRYALSKWEKFDQLGIEVGAID